MVDFFMYFFRTTLCSSFVMSLESFEIIMKEEYPSQKVYKKHTFNKHISIKTIKEKFLEDIENIYIYI